MPIVRVAPLVDMHVHLREPGQEHKETILSGTRAARKGGFGAVACMPNTVPVTDTPERVRWIIERAARDALVTVHVVAAMTYGLQGAGLTDFSALRKAGAAAVSDDGMPLVSDALMRSALLLAQEVGLPVLSHCEPETELARRDIELCRETGAPVHICHVSRRETVDALRRAKFDGLPVTAETCPHYLVDWASGKMNPPLASPEDVAAVVEGVLDGTIDAIVTDHAPHTQAEKSSAQPPNGVIGLETALGVCLTALYHTGKLGLSELLYKMRERPAAILGVPVPAGEIEIDTELEWTVGQFESKSKNTAFPGKTLKGAVNHGG